MQIKEYLNEICEQIKYKPVRKEIAKEIEDHINDIKEDLKNNGEDEEKAEIKAISQMGNAKNRYGLPEECELDYSVIAGIIEEEKNAVKAEKKEEPQYKVERPADEKKMEEPFMQILQ